MEQFCRQTHTSFRLFRLSEILVNFFYSLQRSSIKLASLLFSRPDSFHMALEQFAAAKETYVGSTKYNLMFNLSSDGLLVGDGGFIIITAINKVWMQHVCPINNNKNNNDSNNHNQNEMNSKVTSWFLNTYTCLNKVRFTKIDVYIRVWQKSLVFRRYQKVQF